MGYYAYEALDKAGKKICGIIEAEDEEVVVSKLRGMGYYPTKAVSTDPPSTVSPSGGGLGERLALERAVSQPSGRPGVMILRSRALLIRWIAAGLFVFGVVMLAALAANRHREKERMVLGALSAVGLGVSCLLWTSPRRAEIDREGGVLWVKPGLPNGKILQGREIHELKRYRAVLLSAETSAIHTRINGEVVNYVGVVCLIGPLDCVKLLGYHGRSERAQRVAREAGSKVAQFLNLPLVDEAHLYGVVAEPGDVVVEKGGQKKGECEVAVSLSETMRRGRVEGVVAIRAGSKPLQCAALFVQLIERHCQTRGRGPLGRDVWTSVIREGVEIPLGVTIPSGEQRFVGFDFKAPEGFAPATETHGWRIAARLVAPGSAVVPVGVEM